MNLKNLDQTQLKETLIQELKNSTAIITFVKKDGGERKMVCTLDIEQMPKIEPKPSVESDKKPRASNPEVLPVFDIEAQAWRSFRLDSIKNVETL